jgi:8-oxo-dGTP pyrophosphatase MutT (NUDIX family)
MPYTPLSFAYKLAYAGLRVYWFVFRPQIYGVRCLIEFEGKILMIRQTYGDMRWTFPGGGFKRNESPEMAAAREVKEEVGISLPALRFIGEYTSTEGYKRDNVKCYAGVVGTPHFEIERNEIYEAAWFPWEKLPRPLASDAERVIELYRKAEQVSGAGCQVSGNRKTD